MKHGDADICTVYTLLAVTAMLVYIIACMSASSVQRCLSGR